MDGIVNEGRAHEQRRPSVRAAARAYLGRGWQVVPLKAGEKTPEFKAWPDMRIQAEVADSHFLPTSNIGILTGQASTVDGLRLVDVDCDAAEACAAARELLPPTGRVHGRAGKPNSHYWYLVEGAVETAKFAFAERGALGAGGALGSELPEHAEGGLKSPPRALVSADFSPSAPYAGTSVPRLSAMLVELRASGCQTMAPPSVHPCGEVLRWEGSHGGRSRLASGAPLSAGGGAGDPGRVSAGELVRAVGRVAACALLARHWPAQGMRDEAALCLCGMLLRGGWDPAEADIFTRLVARIAGDEEWKQRGKGQQTGRALAAGDPVMGAPSLAERLGEQGERVVAKVRAWLGLGSHDRADGAPTCPNDAYVLIPRLDHIRSEGAQGQEAGSGAEGPEIGVLLTQVKEEPVHWLWPGRLALGKITMLDGDPGLGKSMVSLDIIARITSGQQMPDGAQANLLGDRVGGAVVLSAEDGLGDTVVPRLLGAGADLSRVVAVRTIPVTDPTTGERYERGFAFPRDTAALVGALERVQARLLVVDPLMAYLDIDIDSSKDDKARRVLDPLGLLAEQMGFAVLVLRHLNKSGGTHALYRGGGSIGFVAKARIGLLIAKDPEDPEHSRVLASSKANIGPPTPGLRYCIESVAGQVAERVRVAWRGECDFTADTLLAALSRGDSQAVLPGALAEAKAWLRETLLAGGRVGAEVRREARAEGISEATLRRARREICEKPERGGFAETAYSIWRLRADLGPPYGSSSTPSSPPSSPTPAYVVKLGDEHIGEHEGKDEHEREGAA